MHTSFITITETVIDIGYIQYIIIYLVLEKTNISDKRATFLDLDIRVIDNKFDIKLYDKRKDFSFNVLSMPNLMSNVPERQTYSVFYSQIFRLCNANSNIDNFISDVKELINKLVGQNFDKNVLMRYLKKFIYNKHPCTYKYWRNITVSMFN